MCLCLNPCDCNDTVDPYAVFKQAIKDGKRVQVPCGISWTDGTTNPDCFAWIYPIADYRIHPDDVDKPTKVPHKYAALIKAWADGAQIQEYYTNNGHWYDIGKGCPILWSSNTKYRIKPEPKPDVVFFTHFCKRQGRIEYLTLAYDTPANAKVTFDGETGKLKKVELI